MSDTTERALKEADALAMQVAYMLSPRGEDDPQIVDSVLLCLQKYREARKALSDTSPQKEDLSDFDKLVEHIKGPPDPFPLRINTRDNYGG